MHTLLIFLAIALLILCSAFFSGSETALTAASRARMYQLEKEGNTHARIVNRLIEARERLIGALLLGNNAVNILASALATSLFITLFPQGAVLYATLVMTALIVIFAEVLPKTYAIANPDRGALIVAPVVSVLVGIMSPLIGAVQWLVRRVLRPFGIDVDAATPVLSAHEELRGAIAVHHLEGTLARGERERLGGVLDLGELSVGDVMVHRKNMVMVDADEPADAILHQVLDSMHSRIPFWRGEPENIIGVLHVKDLLRAVHDAGGNLAGLDIPKLCREPWFVPETRKLKDQLDAFLRRRMALALVVDEYGVLMGLVTLEDILEEIVGQISDEHDVPAAGLRPQADGSVLVDGWLPIRDLNRAMSWSLPDEEATTVAGLVIHEAQTIPEIGQVFLFHGFKFEILRRQRNQITQLRVTPLLKPEAARAM
jgi:Mg2+/Co2+ transporter CorB